MRRITFLQVLNNFFQWNRTQAYECTCLERFIQVGFSKTEKAKIKIRTPILSFTNRIGVSNKMTFIAITKDHPIGAYLFFPIGSDSSRFCGSGPSVRGSLSAAYGKIKPLEKF